MGGEGDAHSSETRTLGSKGEGWCIQERKHSGVVMETRCYLEGMPRLKD